MASQARQKEPIARSESYRVKLSVLKPITGVLNTFHL